MKRKLIIIANVEESVSAERIQHSIGKLDKNLITIDTVYETSFLEGDESSLTAFAIEGDAEITLTNSLDTEPTREQIVTLANYVANGEDLGEGISDSMDTAYEFLIEEGKL